MYAQLAEPAQVLAELGDNQRRWMLVELAVDQVVDDRQLDDELVEHHAGAGGQRYEPRLAGEDDVGRRRRGPANTQGVGVVRVLEGVAERSALELACKRHAGRAVMEVTRHDAS